MNISGSIILLMSALSSATALYLANPLVTPQVDDGVEMRTQTDASEATAGVALFEKSLEKQTEDILAMSPFSPSRQAFSRQLPQAAPAPTPVSIAQPELNVEVLGFLNAPSGRRVLLRIQGQSESLIAEQGDVTPIGTIIEISRKSVEIERPSGERQTLTQY